MQVSPDQLAKLEQTLLSQQEPLHNRFRALFTLKAVGGSEAIRIVAEGFKDPSALLKHEFAYVLGQLKLVEACPVLSAVLEDADEDPMVRHEAAEALGAIGDVGSLAVLRKYLHDSHVEVRETCEIAIAKIEFDNSAEGLEEARLSKENGSVPFATIDPAPGHYVPAPSPMADPSRGPTVLPTTSVAELKATLLDRSLPLFTRYRAMFSLRNLPPSEASVLALAEGFKDPSALFRHEIAYVFGQLTSKYSVPALIERLRCAEEGEMVRHECAEALGGIASEGEDPTVLPLLRQLSTDMSLPSVVRESCVVAVDMYEYETSGQFQYADALGSGEKAIGGGTGFERSVGVEAI